MSQIQQLIGSDGSIINNTYAVSESGELVQHAVLQYVSSNEQENIDPQTSGQQVVMLQPITVSADGTLHLQDGQQFDSSQFQILGDQFLDGVGNGVQTLEVDSNTLQQFQFESVNGQLQAIGLTPLQEQNQVIQTQHVEIVQHPVSTQLTEQPTVTVSLAPAVQKPKRRKEPDIKPPLGKGPYPCEKCGLVFQKWPKLKKHLKKHEEDKPHKCNQCDETFNIEDNLKLHIATHNVGSPKCPECGKTFARIASLKAHLMLHEREETLMCPECGDEYMLQAHLDRHLEEHREEERGGKTYPCKSCNLVFSKLGQLRTHMKQHVKIKASLHHKSYKKNVDRSRFKHKCKFCDKLFLKPSQLERHVRVHTGERPFVCNVCQKAFNQKGALQLHMVKHTGEKDYACGFCNKKFAQKGNLRCHIQRVHSHADDDGVPLFRCEECSCTFKKLGSLNAHMSREHSDHQEIVLKTEAIIKPDTINGRVQQATITLKPGQSMDDGVSIRDAIEQLLELSENKMINKNNIASSVGIEIRNSDENGEHNADIIKQALESSGLPSTRNTDGTKVEDQDPSTRTAVSDGGDMTVPSMLQFQVPVSLLERLPASKREGVIATMSIHDPATGTMKRHVIRKVGGVRWHQCTYCTKEFKKPSDLIRHVRIHTHEKPYKCTMCFRMFAVKSTLTAHVKTHSGVKEYRCHVCGKLFSTHGSLKVHLRLHTGAKPFDCSHCDKKFRTSGHRKTHMQTHFRDADGIGKHKSPRRTPRKIASRQDIPLAVDIQLQEPIMITEAGFVQPPTKQPPGTNTYGDEQSNLDRPYRCGYCSRGFKKSSHLKQHIRSHTGEKPYKCLQCFKSFVSSGVLKAHIRTHTGIKAYKCLMCDSTFTTKGSLKRHVSVHSESRPFMCPYCQKTFKRAVYCKKHMRIHKAELAMQALQEQSSDLQHQLQQQPETEVTIGGDEDDEDDVDVGEEDSGGMQQQIEEIEVSASQEDLTTITQGQILIQDAHGNFTLHQPGDMNHMNHTAVSHIDVVQQHPQHHQQTGVGMMGGTEHLISVPQSSLTDPIVSDVQLQSAIQQQFGQHQVVFTSESLSQQPAQYQQQTIVSQPTTLQSTTETGIATANIIQDNSQHQQQQQHLQLSDNTFIEHFVTTGDGNRIEFNQLALTGGNSIELAGNTAVSAGTSLAATNMQSILQTVEASDAPAVPELDEEMGAIMETIEHHSTGLPMPSIVHEHHHHQQPKKIIAEDSPMSSGGRRNYKCNYCDKSFKKSSHLKQHNRSHTGERPYHCIHCDKYFVSAGVLRTHQKTHIGSKDFRCEVCSAEFTTNGSLTRHLVTHTAEKPYRCMYCEESFKTAILAKRHIKTHKVETEEGEPLPPSHDVHKRTRATNLVQISEEQAEELAQTNPKENMQLSEKILIESASERKRISEIKDEAVLEDEPKHANQCPHCPKSFKKPSDLVRHIRIHTGEKPFGCDICGRSFTVRSTLNSHILIHQNAKKEYCCHVCTSFYSTKGSLKVHMRLHTGAKPFKCPHCPEIFRTSGHRKSHIQQHFKKVITKKRKFLDEKPKMLHQLQLVDQVGEDQEVGLNPVIQLDPLAGQGQGVLPVSLSITDSFGNVADPNLAAQVLQGLEGIQLQLQGQGIHISGVEGGLLSQPLQIDSNLLQQLQNQGNVNISLNASGMFTAGVSNSAAPTMGLSQQHILQVADPNLIQNMELQQPSHVSAIEAAINPNIIIETSQATNQINLIQNPQNENVYGNSHAVEEFEDVSSDNMNTIVSNTGDKNPTIILKTDSMEVESNEVNESLEQEQENTVDDDDDVDEDDDDDEEIEDIQHYQEPFQTFNTTHEEPGVENQTIPETPERIMALELLECQNASRLAGQEREEVRIHVCSICSKAFKRASHVKEHMQIHLGLNVVKVKNTPHKCSHCEKSFQKPSQLERHMRIHTGERPYKCEICKKSFNQKNALQIHLKKHTGDRPYRCDYCQVAFSQKGNLKVHIKRYHHHEMMSAIKQNRTVVTEEPATIHHLASIQTGSSMEDDVAISSSTVVVDGSKGVPITMSGDSVINALTGEHIQLSTQGGTVTDLDLNDLISI